LVRRCVFVTECGFAGSGSEDAVIAILEIDVGPANEEANKLGPLGSDRGILVEEEPILCLCPGRATQPGFQVILEALATLADGSPGHVAGNCLPVLDPEDSHEIQEIAILFPGKPLLPSRKLGLLEYRSGGAEARGGGGSAELTDHQWFRFAVSIFKPRA
jgi:hypothetical protein